jgi:hypothetical protein
MKQLTDIQLAEINSNLDNYFALATDSDIDNGIAWYKQAHYIYTAIFRPTILKFVHSTKISTKHFY